MRLPRSVRRTAVWLVATVCTVYLWNVATSVILCLAIGRAEFLSPPFFQWWEAVGLFSMFDWQTKVWILISPLIPSTVVFALVVRQVRRRSPARVSQAKLYGASDWASDEDERSNGVRRKGSLF